MRGLCANGIPFNVLRNPQFQEMVVAINKAPAGYKAPSSEKARTVLLDECARDVEKDLVPVKDTWYTQGVSIVSDGWSNVKHKPLINILAVNSRGATFMYAEDFSGVEKTGVEISKFLLEAIESIGPSNVLQVVTDNAANCKAAGEEVEKVHKHIFWSPCVVHTLNLIFKDLAKEFVWLSDTYKRGKMIVKYFLNHAQALSIFRENSKLELLKVAKTRFASHYILLKRLKECREALATTIVLNSWRDWAKKGDEKTRKIGQVVCETIRSDEFWDDVDRILAITKPIYLLIKFYDGEGAKMGEVYERMDNMVGEIKDVMKNVYNSYFPEVQKIVLARWEKMTIPLHCLGFALTPRFYDKTYLSTKAPGGIPRKPPNLDKEVTNGVIDAFKRISENDEETQMLRAQYARFHMKKGLYARPEAQIDAVTMDPIDWWSTYGSETPELAEIAKKVLSQPVSSSSAERNWSTYSFIHSIKRNRLNTKRADKLVFVHSNIRLISRFSESYKEGPSKKWDVNPESAYLEASASRMEDMRWENLDED
ncbi:putative hAT dimerization domain, ribonuclease H-like superfamily protein [Tanacetum coccineum]